ncbi:BTB/POZ domain-containing protein 8 [Cytospora mali]|uniref:BTB/POZ domain-containing protein 8 n=1 Tax=Cytospora mali TaxID=578113 RepID=A0A194V6B5_CYTMA|nr:BTB/POZ domain-containing protein 8 [Valsa mali var. pyri (nom. inval.)]
MHWSFEYVHKTGNGEWSLASDGCLGRSDLELLHSGLLADAQVVCGNRTWEVHKLILCTRSEWFKKALLGPFEEGQTGKITITAFTEDEVECLLQFLYAGYIDFETQFPETTTLVAIVKMGRLADFFLLDSLKQLLREAADSTSREPGIRLCSPALHVLYQDDAAAVRGRMLPSIWKLIISATVVHPVEAREGFEDMFRKNPEFAVDWAIENIQGSGEFTEVMKRKFTFGQIYCQNEDCDSKISGSAYAVDVQRWINKRITPVEVPTKMTLFIDGNHRRVATQYCSQTGGKSPQSASHVNVP